MLYYVRYIVLVITVLLFNVENSEKVRGGARAEKLSQNSTRKTAHRMEETMAGRRTTIITIYFYR